MELPKKVISISISISLYIYTHTYNYIHKFLFRVFSIIFYYKILNVVPILVVTITVPIIFFTISIWFIINLFFCFKFIFPLNYDTLSFSKIHVYVFVCILESIFLALNEELSLNFLRIQELCKSYSCFLAQDMSCFNVLTHYLRILLEWRFWVRPWLSVSKKNSMWAASAGQKGVSLSLWIIMDELFHEKLVRT